MRRGGLTAGRTRGLGAADTGSVLERSRGRRVSCYKMFGLILQTSKPVDQLRLAGLSATPLASVLLLALACVWCNFFRLL